MKVLVYVLIGSLFVLVGVHWSFSIDSARVSEAFRMERVARDKHDLYEANYERGVLAGEKLALYEIRQWARPDCSAYGHSESAEDDARFYRHCDLAATLWDASHRSKP